jgi:hypothetical protein
MLGGSDSESQFCYVSLVTGNEKHRTCKPTVLCQGSQWTLHVIGALYSQSAYELNPQLPCEIYQPIAAATMGFGVPGSHFGSEHGECCTL